MGYRGPLTIRIPHETIGGKIEPFLYHFIAVFPASNLLLLEQPKTVKMGCKLVKLVVQCLCMFNKIDLAISSLFLSFLFHFL